MTYAEKLEMFADLATESQESEYTYWDVSDPDNMQRALDYFNRELTFLSGRDKDDLMKVWMRACEDCRDTKLLFNAVKVLQGKYEQHPRYN